MLFRDLTPVLADADAFAELVDGLLDRPGATVGVDLVLGIEARGFVLGAAVARSLRVGFVSARKPGRLPAVAHRADYVLEYGSAALELPAGVLSAGQRVLVVDDVLATGGTMSAACALVDAAGASVAGVAVAIELAALDGRARLAGHHIHAHVVL